MNKTLTFNFHVHTRYSLDGFNSFTDLYHHARKNKIDVLAITDHDTTQGAFDFSQWLKEKRKTDLQVIIGEEVTCSDGTHIIGLFLKNPVESKTPLDVVQEIKDQGAFVYFPHPQRNDGILNSASFEEVIPWGDFYECFNAKISHEYNETALNTLSRYSHLQPLGGSDAHYNYDIRKCICTLEEEGSLFETLAAYKRSGSIKIDGVKKWGSNNYLPGYYKVKNIINPPAAVKTLAKKIFPYYKNYKDSKQQPVFETILNTLHN